MSEARIAARPAEFNCGSPRRRNPVVRQLSVRHVGPDQSSKPQVKRLLPVVAVATRECQM